MKFLAAALLFLALAPAHNAKADLDGIGDREYFCTAGGYDDLGNYKSVFGDTFKTRKDAIKGAKKKCVDSKLSNCQVNTCAEESG